MSENEKYLTDGLSLQEVNERHEQGLDNHDTGAKTRSVKQIILDNTFTFFNIVNFILVMMVILVGSFKNVTFFGTVIINAVIGMVQEIRSKKTIDKLSLISSPKVTVLREGQEKTIGVTEIVLDDLMILGIGNQVCSDSIIVSGECEVDESLLTGESDPVNKKPGDHLLSGSFIVSGNVKARVEHVGEENYATQLAGNAKFIKKPNSEIVRSLNGIVKVVSFSLIPVGTALFCKAFFLQGDTLRNSVVSTVAALIGMIPEGLILLTSVVFAVSVVRLSRYKTLVQQLYCVETLARVDVLCLDKTGTITEGSMQVEGFIPFEGHNEDEMAEICGALTTVLDDNNPTFNALLDMYGRNSDWTANDVQPFSSAKKWSGASFEGRGTYIMGAGEFILGENFESVRSITEKYSSKGSRVLLLAKSTENFRDKELPENIETVGLILISDKIREEAPATLRYFADQGVELKVISGDNPVTVSKIAEKAGLENADMYVDASTLHTDEQIKDAVLKYSVFGRVTPDQKCKFVKFLKEAGHTVAMTGDGVNDVPALRESDCSIAMASGSDAARTVSDLVLLDSNFASLPKVVREGRRSINNLQRSAALFLTKTIFAILLSILFIFVKSSYLFQPIQISLISGLTIGVPSFILALEPNRDRVKGSFLLNVIRKAIPSALPVFFNIVFLVMVEESFGLSYEALSTVAVIVTFFAEMVMLFRVSFPFNAIRGTLFFAMAAGFILAYIFLGWFVSLITPSFVMLIVLLPLMLFTVFTNVVLSHLIEHVFIKKND
ncbi:MAG: HAD-IC family P-type ATPase [Clostridia bacterium]|nr:HAD-IC family P-type ATPase [Clostridia bacterium]